MSKIILPRTIEDGDHKGKYYISYSQIKLWHDAKGFSTGLMGRMEYIRSYFLGEEYPDFGWAEFGDDVEDYVCEKKGADKFTDEEKAVMDKITPLGNFQVPIAMDFGDFIFTGYKDDTNDDESIVRDYKTASARSKEQYYTDKYKQLDLYALDTLRKTGKLPEKLEVVIIERLGNAFRGGRGVLTVGNEIWTVEKEVKEERIEAMEKLILDTTQEISDYYQTFLELNKIKV